MVVIEVDFMLKICVSNKYMYFW